MPSFPDSEIVVADASPFIHLDRAGCLGVLPALFRVVRVPETVAAEIAAGRNRGLAIPDVVSLSWVRIEADRDDPAVRLQPGLDAGEIAALSVARAIAADVVIEKNADGYYVASVPRLRGCHTQARSLDELLVRIREAIEACLEVGGNDEEPLSFVGVHRVAVSG